MYDIYIGDPVKILESNRTMAVHECASAVANRVGLDSPTPELALPNQ
jgi:hypothetical protein